LLWRRFQVVMAELVVLLWRWWGGGGLEMRYWDTVVVALDLTARGWGRCRVIKFH
jgi:hypothetical protein